MLQTATSPNPIKMQAALCFAPSPLPLLTPTKTLASPRRFISGLQTSLCPPIKATTVAPDNSTVDYSSMNSVFPAEACETIGGEACDVEMYPEVKLKPEGRSPTAGIASEPVDREYVEYDSPKTVFPGEACDDLGGEFCEPDYQKGVYLLRGNRVRIDMMIVFSFDLFPLVYFVNDTSWQRT